MLQDDPRLVELERLVEDNRIAFERAKQLLDSMKSRNNTASQSEVGEAQAGSSDESTRGRVTIQRDSGLQSGAPWLDLEMLAQAEVTSEGLAAYPIASALSHEIGLGWRSREPGWQTIRLVFAVPQSIHRIQLVFVEENVERTQEFVLRWRQKGDQEYREIVRQQYVFSPGGSTQEIEDYQVDLKDLMSVELSMTPNVSGGNTCASLVKWSMA